MTSDEHRKACIKAMALVMSGPVTNEQWNSFEPEERLEWLSEATAVLDSLHGIARVDPIEATDEMIKAGEEHWCGRIECTCDDEVIYRAMAAAGDLTNPPETKP